MNKKTMTKLAVAGAVLVGAGSALVTWIFCRDSRKSAAPAPHPDAWAELPVKPRPQHGTFDPAPIPQPPTPRRSLSVAGIVWTLLILAVLGTVGGVFGTQLETQRSNRQLAMSLTGGQPDQGKAAIERYGCAGCHTIPGIRGANALVGPPLTQIGSRTYVAGVLQNTPVNLIHWIQDPPSINPHTAMPNLRVTDDDARDIATYLYTLQ